MVALTEGCGGSVDASVIRFKYEVDGEGDKGYRPANGKR